MGFKLVPAHVCVKGNKGVDNLAKNATEKQRIEFALEECPFSCKRKDFVIRTNYGDSCHAMSSSSASILTSEGSCSEA